MQTTVGRSEIAGEGVMARRDFAEAEVVGYVTGEVVSRPTQHSLTFGGLYVEPDCAWRYVNHSCRTNATLEGRWVVSTRRVEQGEEITIDYLAHEKLDDFRVGFVCSCGHDSCRGRIGP